MTTHLKPLTLRHVALYVKNFAECEYFYTELLGMKIDWRPDADNLYLTSGTDNLALHRAPANFEKSLHQSLDHMGFFVESPEAVDAWHNYLLKQNVDIKAAPKNHRDGTRSFYCADPDGTIVQVIYFPMDNRDAQKV